MQAAKMNHGDVVTLLLDKGANIDLVNKVNMALCGLNKHTLVVVFP